jgi:hypothetical protein
MLPGLAFQRRVGRAAVYAQRAWSPLPRYAWCVSFSHLRPVFVAFGLAVSAACATPPAPAVEPAPAPVAEPQPEPEPATDAARAEAQAEIQAITNEIIAAVGLARALEVTGEVEVELISRVGVRDFVKDALYEDITPEELQLLARIEASLGVLPLGSNGEQVLLDLYEQGVLGIYDHKKKTLLIGDFVDRSTLGHVIGHEIAHGLQDMHFDLERLQEPVKGNSDFDAARTFLVEGGAEAGYLAYVHRKDGGIGGVSTSVLGVISNHNLGVDETLTPFPVLARMLQMPYGDGTATVVALAQTDGWEAIDGLYADLPTTTEQMLHVDKLEKREPAHEITVDTQTMLDAFGGYAVAYEDNLGEAALLAMLADVAETGEARAGAAGWGGDRFLAIDRTTSPQPAPVVVGLISWDAEREAREFEPVFRRYLEHRVGEDFILERKRDKVVYATRLDGNDPKTVSKAAWKAFGVSKASKRKKNGKNSKGKKGKPE